MNCILPSGKSLQLRRDQIEKLLPRFDLRNFKRSANDKYRVWRLSTIPDPLCSEYMAKDPNHTCKLCPIAKAGYDKCEGYLDKEFGVGWGLWEYRDMMELASSPSLRKAIKRVFSWLYNQLETAKE